MPSAVVVEKSKCITKIPHAFYSFRRKKAIESPQPVLEGFEPPFDVVSIPAREHDMFQSEPLRWPAILGAAVADEDQLALTIAEATLEKL